ncbi:MAG: hypothetical protein ACREFQ_01420 [Stellaceae bacterium]
MTNAYVIEMRSRAAGVAVRDRRGFRFFAAEGPFFALDKRLFPNLRAVRRAVGRLLKRLDECGDGGRRSSSRVGTAEG